MMPAGPLMIEHRLIERMIKIIRLQTQLFQADKKADIVFIDTAIDFIRTYADKCHHGKEEDILFMDLAKKELRAEHKKTMEELIQEHIYARNTTKSLVSAKERYAQGDKQALFDIVKLMEELVVFYPKHIEKEDKHFFIPVMKYFSEAEQKGMLKEFAEFDRGFDHAKYKMLALRLEKEKK
ncbi:MAG TPA: cation-binding protein [Candidatus Omnitrophota bacterium]|nr:cation-binding protein [Candidatus Omnitrophota bacterium]